MRTPDNIRQNLQRAVTNLIRFQKLAFAFQVIAICFTVAAQVQSPTSNVSPQEVTGPKIQFLQTDFDFGKAESGEVWKHSFVFSNVGRETLVIKDVLTSCGCTTAGEWDRKVEPGKTGKIPVQFNTLGFSGLVSKGISVLCNDPGSSNVTLKVTGTVWKPIEVAPAYAIFNYGPDVQTNDSRVVRITSNVDTPLQLSDVVCTNSAFKAELKTIREGKEFDLHVSVTPPQGTTTFSAPITIKSSYPKVPVLSVLAWVIVQPLVGITPTQITLPAGPLTNTVRYVVTFRNNSTNDLFILEPLSNIPGLELHLKTLQTNRVFELTAIFPAGLQTAPGQALSLTVRTSNPKFPLLNVPVFQMPSLPTSSPPVVTPVQVAASNPAPAKDSSGPPLPAQTLPGKTPPKIEFTETFFDFGRVASGKTIQHDFTFVNHGQQTLEITDIRSSCGCTTTTNYASRVEPGKTGVLPVLFNTSGMGGPVAKTLWVLCNDPGQSNVLLQIMATVTHPIDAIPGIAAFSFGPDGQTEQTRLIRLVSNEKEPVTLSDPVCTNRSFRVGLKTIREGKEFELSVTAVPPLPAGSTRCPITIRTSTTNMPELVVSAYAQVEPAVLVMPPRIFVRGSSTNSRAFSVSIQNRTTNALALSAPAISAAGIDAELKELKHGRQFNLTLHIPPGFKFPPGREIEARVKSNHPDSSEIAVPVIFMESGE